MNIKRLSTLAIGLAAIISPTWARQLTPAEALDAARSASPNRAVATAHIDPSPVFTATEGTNRTLYIFNSAGSGFVVVAADDVAMPLLGYSSEGEFDPTAVPPQMQWWLEQYSAEIAWAIDNNVRPTKVSVATPSKAPIEPIVKTKWNQGAPYNNYCPTLPTSNGSTARAVTGCVATAMAQAVKVHNWPTKGVGSLTYNYTSNGTTYSESFNFGTTTFAWSNMLDDYAATPGTSAQQSAVAVLMHACGVAAKMNYGVSASGANTLNAARGLVDYLNYDKGLTYNEREYFTYNEWVDMAYADLAQGNPVIIGGANPEGGHEFVCDGYSNNDYFHINWGWGGASDGYFLLSALDPSNQGIGGSSSGYNSGQEMITGIRPPVEGSGINPVITFTGDFVPRPGSSEEPSAGPYSKSTGVVYFGYKYSDTDYSLFLNRSIAALDIYLGLKLEKSNGTVEYIPWAYGTDYETLNVNSGFYAMPFYASAFPTGTYTVTPAVNYDGEWYDVRTDINNIRSVKATVTSSQVTFTIPEHENAVSVTSVSFDTPFYIGQKMIMAVGIEATGEFYGEITPVLLDSSNKPAALGEQKAFSLTDSESLTLDWVTGFTAQSGVTFDAGNYKLCFVDNEGYIISNIYPMTVNAEQTTSPTATVQSVVFNGVAGAGTSSNPYIIDPTNMSVTVTMLGTSGFWTDNLQALFFNSPSGSYAGSLGSRFAAVEENHTYAVTFTGAVPALGGNTLYWFSPFSSEGQITGITYVKTVETSGVGIAQITDDKAPAVYPNPTRDRIIVTGTAKGDRITVSSIAGAVVVAAEGSDDSTEINVSALAPGHYVVTVSGAHHNHSLRFIKL